MDIWTKDFFMTFLSDQLYDHILRLKTGDEKAFRIVYDEYIDSIYSFVLRFVKSRNLADDVVQDVFIKIWEKREHIDMAKSFQAYLYKVAKNHVLNVLIRYKHEAKVQQEIMAGAVRLVNATEEEIYFQEATQLLQEGITRLPPQQKKIFELCKAQGLTYEQAAQELNLSPQTINAQMVNSLRFLKKHLLSRGHLASVALSLLYL